SKGNALAAFWLARGIAATSTRDFNMAQDCYLRAIAHSPLWADPHAALGNMLIGAGRAPDAIPSFEAALHFEPGRRDATYGLGMALLTDCRCDDAVTLFRRASQSDPDHQSYYLGLGAALHLSGKLRGAISAWTAGMEVQARLAKQAGIASEVRYLTGIFTQAIGHLAHIDIW